jgi:uncharacterized membrane protein
MSDFLKIGELKDNLVKLIEAKFELTKLNVQDKVESVAVKAVHALVTFILGVVVLIFLSILIAIGLNILLKSSWAGFLIVFAIYAIIFAVFIFAKDAVIASIKKKVEEVVDEQMNEKKD